MKFQECLECHVIYHASEQSYNVDDVIPESLACLECYKIDSNRDIGGQRYQVTTIA